MPQYQIPTPKLTLPSPPPELVYGASFSNGPASYQIPMPKLPLLALASATVTEQVFMMLGVGS